ncbi:MAG: hypothetical protein ABGZ36_24490 [Actinomycetota bacterium]
MTAPDLESLRPQVLALDSEPARRFALLCGQRMAEVHRLADATSAPAFDEVIDRLWDTEAVEDAAVNAMLGRAEKVSEDRATTVQHTTSCLAYAHRAVAGGAEEAAWCAQQLTDLIDEWILVQSGVSVVDAAAEASVSGHPSTWPSWPVRSETWPRSYRPAATWMPSGHERGRKVPNRRGRCSAEPCRRSMGTRSGWPTSNRALPSLAHRGQ